MVKDLHYYENKLDMIIYLLNSTDREETKRHLLNEYYSCYNEYEIKLKEVRYNEKRVTSSTMDWI